jgi:glutamate synthase (ferredoxin)
MLRHCHLNNCSVGVATQDDILQKRFRGRPEYIVNYFRFIAQELREIMAGLGLRTIDDMIGRTDLLEVSGDTVPLKAKGIDYSRILYKPDLPEGAGRYCMTGRESGLDHVLDRRLIEMCKDSLDKNKPVNVSSGINNADRSVGAMLSGEVCRRCGDGALLENTIMCKFRGIAGQSFGAFLAKGVTFELEGMANDYTGKGISGGKVIIYPDRDARYEPDKNVIIGNTTFYGAISGEAYVCGIAGERFCIRNSGLYAVVEGVGDHGCEYMTGGRVVILGKTGRNFAAGMSGGIAYVYDEDGALKDKCNTDMVEMEKVKDGDKDTIYNLLHNHFKNTRSRKAKKIIDNMNEELKKFVRVIPIEYKRILEGASDG